MSVHSAKLRSYLRHIVACMFFAQFAHAQLAVTVSIENQSVVSSDFYFDIYLFRSSPDPDDIFLAGSDFVLSYDQTNFDSPTIEKVDGYCTLTPSDHSGSNDQITQANYFANTMVTLMSDLVIVNLAGPSPNATTINTRVAVLDDKVQVHRLGRFKISGIINPEQKAGLQWKIGVPGLTTLVFSFEQTAPFMANQINSIIGAIQLCLTNRTIDSSPVQDGFYHAQSSITSTGSIDSGTSVVFDAGSTVSLLPNFTTAQNATFEIKMDGCQN